LRSDLSDTSSTDQLVKFFLDFLQNGKEPAALKGTMNQLCTVGRYVILVLALCATSITRAVILLSTGDPAANTTEPTNTLAGSGWQYEGSFGWFLGTAIGPHHFITVKHIGIASGVFVYAGSSYTIVQSFDDPMSELRIFEVAETMPTYASLYTRGDELGRNTVVIGRGTQRGDPVYLGGTLRGWLWGPTDGVQRWGESQVAVADGTSLYATFNQNGSANEAQLSSGDSGGATFISDAGVWKLAGINYGIDDAVSTAPTGSGFNAALFDARGFYDSSQQMISGPNPVPRGFYALRISQRLSWIESVISPGSPSPTPSPTPTPTAPQVPTPSPTPSPSSMAQMISPPPGSTLSGSTATFTWSAGDAANYSVLVGSSPGGSGIYNSGKLGVHSATVGNIPTRGESVYVRLRSLIQSKWQSIDYNYTAYSYNPSPSPTPSATATPNPTATPAPSATPLATATPTPRVKPTPPDRGL
jgi:hypothetical protein